MFFTSLDDTKDVAVVRQTNPVSSNDAPPEVHAGAKSHPSKVDDVAHMQERAARIWRSCKQTPPPLHPLLKRANDAKPVRIVFTKQQIT